MKELFQYNKLVRVEVRTDKVTSDAGALLCREALSVSGVDRWLNDRIDDTRDARRIHHSLAELVRTVCLLVAQGRRDHDDAMVLREDTAFRLAGWRLRAHNGGCRLVQIVVDARRYADDIASSRT